MMLGMAPLSPFPLDVTPKKPKPPSRQSTSILEARNPVAGTAVSLEYASIRHQNHTPLGMYVLPTAENILEWDCVLFIHQGT